MTADKVTNESKQESPRGRRRSRQASAKAAPSHQSQQNQGSTVQAPKDRPTPSRRTNNKKGNIITRTFRPLIDYFTSTRAELQKVTWPTRREATRLSGIVLAVTVAFSIGLGVLDYLYGELFRLGLVTPSLFIIFGAVLVAVVGGGALVMRRRSGL